MIRVRVIDFALERFHDGTTEIVGSCWHADTGERGTFRMEISVPEARQFVELGAVVSLPREAVTWES